MEESELNGGGECTDARPGRIDAPFNGVDARFAEMRQLIVGIEKVQKIVLTEVEGWRRRSIA